MQNDFGYTILYKTEDLLFLLHTLSRHGGPLSLITLKCPLGT